MEGTAEEEDKFIYIIPKYRGKDAMKRTTLNRTHYSRLYNHSEV